MGGARIDELRELLTLLRDSGVVEYEQGPDGVVTKLRLAPKLAQPEPKQAKDALPSFGGHSPETIRRALGGL